MPFLREAVEKKRKYFIHILVKAGIYKQSDPNIQHLTLTELEQLFRKYHHTQTK